MVATIDWSPYSIFKRALRRGDLAGVRAAAAELPRVPLDDAFVICMLILAQQSAVTSARPCARSAGSLPRYAPSGPSLRHRNLRLRLGRAR